MFAPKSVVSEYRGRLGEKRNEWLTALSRMWVTVDFESLAASCEPVRVGGSNRDMSCTVPQHTKGARQFRFCLQEAWALHKHGTNRGQYLLSPGSALKQWKEMSKLASVLTRDLSYPKSCFWPIQPAGETGPIIIVVIITSYSSSSTTAVGRQC